MASDAALYYLYIRASRLATFDGIEERLFSRTTSVEMDMMWDPDFARARMYQELAETYLPKLA